MSWYRRCLIQHSILHWFLILLLWIYDLLVRIRWLWLLNFSWRLLGSWKCEVLVWWARSLQTTVPRKDFEVTRMLLV